MGWEILYYDDVVLESVNGWPVGVRAYYARITERMQAHGPNLGMPFTRSMEQGLFEVRAKGREGIGRASFCTIAQRKKVILHTYIKKSQKTPQKELSP